MDENADTQLARVLANAAGGRARMDTTIGAAASDVATLGPISNTPEGSRALIAAIRRHLEDTRATAAYAGSDATNEAAAARTQVGQYGDIGGGGDGGHPADQE